MGDRVWGTEEESGQLIRVEPHLQQTLWTSSFLDQGSVFFAFTSPFDCISYLW